MKRPNANKYWLLVLIGFCFLCGSVTAGRGFYARYELHPESGSPKYDVIVVWPREWGHTVHTFVPGLAQVLVPEAAAALGDVALTHNSELAHAFVQDAHAFAVSTYRGLGVINTATERELLSDLAPVLEMRWPLLAVVPHAADAPILHMVAFAPSVGGDLPIPSLQRLWGNGGHFHGEQCPYHERLRVLEVYPLLAGYDVTVSDSEGFHGRVAWPDPNRLGEEHVALTLLQSLVPRVVGSFTEAKLFIANPEVSSQLSKTVHALAITFGFHRYSPHQEISAELRDQLRTAREYPPVEQAFLEVISSLEPLGVDLPWQSLRENWRRLADSAPVHNEFVFAEVMGRRNINVFEMLYGVSPAQVFYETRFAGAPTAIFKMPLQVFENVPAVNLARVPGYAEQDGSALRPAAIGLRRQLCAAQLLSPGMRWAIPSF